MNHVVWIVFDSARYDTFLAAKTPNLDRIATVERRWSYASWTAPSHYTYLMGVTPHNSAKGVFASTQYRNDVMLWSKRLCLGNNKVIDFTDFVPSLSLPAFLKNLGYISEAYVSLPVLNPQTILSQHFDHFELMPSHNDFQGIINKLNFQDAPKFYFINAGETHYPYLLPNEGLNDLPRLSGLHGVYRHLDDFLRNPASFLKEGHFTEFFTPEKLRYLWEKQVSCIEHLDNIFGYLLEMTPDNTWFIVTSDHGELFGEDGFFGHGPIMHEKVFEVFFLEGQHP